MPEQSNDYRVVVFGAGGVGKSSLVLRFVRGTFRDTYVPTIEDTYRQVISCNKQVRASFPPVRFVAQPGIVIIADRVSTGSRPNSVAYTSRVRTPARLFVSFHSSFEPTDL